MGKTDSAYEYIKAKIINGDYPPLSDISEDTLQKEMNMSRTPVREAILRLEKEERRITAGQPVRFDHSADRKAEMVRVREALRREMNEG